MVAEGLYDAPFVDASTAGFQQLKDFLTDKTPAWAAPICDVPAETIRRLARARSGPSGSPALLMLARLSGLRTSRK